MRLPTPTDLLRLPAAAVDAVQAAVALVPQVAVLVRDLDALVREARVVIAEASATRAVAQQVAEESAETLRAARQVVDRARAAEAAAAAAVVEVSALSARAADLLTRWEPALERLAPVADRVADGVRPSDAAALADVVRQAPAVVAQLTDDILPVLDSLETVAPDLREVRDVSEGLEEMLGAVPGLGRVKKRVDARQRRRPSPAD